MSLRAEIRVARGANDGDVVVVESRDLIAQAGAGSRTVVVAAVAQRHIDGNDVVRGAIGDHPLQRLFDVGKASAPGVAEHLERDDVAAGRHARIGRVLRADDARDVRAVAVGVGGVGIVGAREVVLKDDAVGDAVRIGIGAEERVIDVDAGVGLLLLVPSPNDMLTATIL